MQAKPECQHCFQRQTDNAARLAGLDAETVARLKQAVSAELAAQPADLTLPAKASRVHALVRQISANPDPYRTAKQEATEHALSLYPHLKQMIEVSADPLDTAVRLAIAGNIIDLGVANEYDLEASIERVLDTPLAIDHITQLKAVLRDARAVLFLGDNAGETVMDRLLIETLPLPVTYVVKGGPAVNDATREDAVAAGLDQVCEVMDNGAAILGTILDECSVELRERFWSADVVIAKGMANYESLSGTRSKLFFLLQAKCAVIAGYLGVAEKSLIVMEDTPA